MRRKIRDHVAGVVGVMVAETPTGPVSPGFAVHRPHRLRVAAARGTGVGVRMFPPSAVTTAHSRRCRWVGQLRSTTAPRGREGIPMITTADAPHVLFRKVLITPLLPVGSSGTAHGEALFVMVTLSDSTVRRVTTGRKAFWLAPEFGILVCEPRMTRGHSKVSGFALKRCGLAGAGASGNMPWPGGFCGFVGRCATESWSGVGSGDR